MNGYLIFTVFLIGVCVVGYFYWTSRKVSTSVGEFKFKSYNDGDDWCSIGSPIDFYLKELDDPEEDTSNGDDYDYHLDYT